MGCGISSKRNNFLLPEPIGQDHSRNAILSLIDPEHHNLAKQLFVRYELEHRIQLEKELLSTEATSTKRTTGIKVNRKRKHMDDSDMQSPTKGSPNSADSFMGFQWSSSLLKELQKGNYLSKLDNAHKATLDIRYNENVDTSSPSSSTNLLRRRKASLADSHVSTIIGSPTSARGNSRPTSQHSTSLRPYSSHSQGKSPLLNDASPSSPTKELIRPGTSSKPSMTPMTPILSPVSINSSGALHSNKISITLSIDLATSRLYAGFFHQKKLYIVQDSEFANSQITGKRVVKFDPSRLLSRTDTTLDLAQMAQVSFANTLSTSSTQSDNNSSSENAVLPFHKIDIIEKLFCKLKALAKKKVSELVSTDCEISISTLIVTIPSAAGNMERRKLSTAAQRAGLRLIRITTGSTSAALQIGNEMPSDKESYLLIYSHGYSVADISIVKVHFGIFEILASVGDNTVGGNAFTKNLASYLQDMYERNFGKVEEVDSATRKKLMKHAEALKKQLSQENSATVYLENVFDHDLELGITREKFEEINRELFDRCHKLLIQALADAKLDRFKISDVITLGSANKQHGISQLLQRDFQEHLIRHEKHDVVVKGAALQAANCQQTDQPSSGISFVMVDVFPFRITIELNDGLCIEVLPPLSSLPFKTTKHFTTVEEGQKGVHVKLYEHTTLQSSDDQQLAGEFKFAGIPDGLPVKKAILELTVGVKENQEMRVYCVCKCGSVRVKLDRLKETDPRWKKAKYPLPEFVFIKNDDQNT